jgi:hypothetical protein
MPSDLSGAEPALGRRDAPPLTLTKAVTLSGGSTEALAWLGYTYAVSGKRGEAQKTLDDLNELSTQRSVAPYWKTTLQLTV